MHSRNHFSNAHILLVFGEIELFHSMHFYNLKNLKNFAKEKRLEFFLRIRTILFFVCRVVIRFQPIQDQKTCP